MIMIPMLQATHAHAYVASTDQVLNAWSTQHFPPEVADLTLTLSTERMAKAETVEQRLYLKKPERLRLLDNPVAGAQSNVYVEREGAYGHGIPPAIKRGPGNSESLLAALIFPRGKSSDEQAKALQQRLGKVGIKTSVISLSFFDDRPVYIIGAMPWETTKPQLWLDKDRLVPVRYIVAQRTYGTTSTVAGPSAGPTTTPAATPTMVETRFIYVAGTTLEIVKQNKAAKDDKTTPLTLDETMPIALETYVNDALIQRATITKREVNRRLPETLFDLPATR